MTNFNFLSNLAAENEVNRALATAKVLQNAGGGTSHTSEQFSRYCVSRFEGAHKAEHFSQKTYSLFAVAADGEPTVNRQSRLMLHRCYLRNLAMIFAILTLSIANIGMAWGERITFSDEKYASGTITFADFGNMDVKKNYWYNGIKVYSGVSSRSADASNSTWSEAVSVPAYIANKTAGKDADKGKWGSAGSGKQYTMSGLAFNTHAIGIHVNGKCTVTVVVDKNIGSDADEAGITASVDATAYGTAWTDVTYKTAGTALEVTSTRADKTNYPGRYTLTIPITTDGEKVVKMFNSSEGTGAGKLFCFESITVTPASSGYKLSVFNSSTNGEYNFVAGTGENEIVINDFVIPKYTAEGDLKQFWVGPGSYTGYARNEYFSWKRAYHQQNNTCTSNLTLGSPVNAIGTLHAWTNSDQPNYGLCFEPNGYGIVWGVENSPWTNVPFESTGEPTVWLTDIVSLTSDMISTYKYYVGLLTNDGGYVGSFREEGNACGLSKTDNISGMRRKTASGDNWADGLVAGHGKFRIWVNNCTQNFYCHFVPHYKLTYNANGGEGAPEAAYVSVEETPCQWTLSNTQPTWADHVFLGWSTNPSATEADADAEVADLGNPYGATGDVTLYAVWQACSGPSYTEFNKTGTTDGTHNVGDELGSLSVTATPQNGGTLSYQWYQYDDATGKVNATVAAGTNNEATYNIPNNAECTNRHYYCVISESGCSKTAESAISGALTLTKPVYDIIYAANIADATGSTASATGKSAGYTEPAKACGYSKSGYKFKWWNTSADGSGEDFYVGETVTLGTGNLTLYAQWEQVESGWAYWVGDDASSSPTDIAGNGVTMRLTRESVDYNTDLTKDATIVSKYSSTNKHAKVLAVASNNNSLQIQFTDGSPINSLLLGVTTNDASSKNIVVCFSTTEDFSTGEYEFVKVGSNNNVVAVPGNTQTTKDITTVSPSTANKYYYARIYRKLTKDTQYNSTGEDLGSGNTTRIYSIKAQKGAVSDYTGLSVTKDPSEGSASDPTISATSVAQGSGVTVTAGAAAAGYVFTGWTSENGTFADANSLSTTFTPNADNAVATAHYTATKTITIKFQHNDNTTGWVIQSKTTYPADQKATIDVDGDWVVMTFSNVYAVSNIDLASSSGDWDYLNTSTKITDDACYNWTGEAISCAELTAIEANTLYEVPDMIPSGKSLTSDDQFFEGLSANTKFELIGSASGSKTPKVNNNSSNDRTIDDIPFDDGSMWFKGKASLTNNIPTTFGLSFIVPEGGGKLYLYFNNTGTSTNIKLAKSGSTGSNPTLTDGFAAVDVTAGTYYLYGTGTTSPYSFYGLKLCSTYGVTITPTNVTKETGATGAGAAIHGKAYTATFTANTGYTLPSDVMVTIGGTPATKGTEYTWSVSDGTGTLTVLAAQVTGDIVVTIAGETAPAGDCDELFAGRATSTSVFTPSTGSATFHLTSGDSFSSGGYSCSVKPDKSNAIVASPKDGGSFAAGDSLIVVVYNNQSSSKTMGFKLGSGTYSEEVAAKKLHVFRQKLVASDIDAGKVTFNRQSADDRWVEIIIKHCGLLPSCTPPVLPDLTNKTICEGGDADAAWNATITNSGSLVSGETVAYSWVKKGGSTPVSSEATYQPTSVTEAMAGTYVVTATVLADGKASSMATKEVTLTVNEATEVTAITADKATVYPTNSVTLTATANVDATWQWYTCTNAEGAGEAIINDATSANYTIASAPDAGTYYYKVKATGNCGTAARVYTLVVSPAVGGDCETEFWFAKAADKPESATAATHITGTPSGSSGVTYTATIDGNSYPITGSTGQKTGNVTITVPEDNEGTLYVVVAGSSNRTITLSKGVEQVGQETPANSTWGTFTFDGLDAGTYTLVSSGNISWGIIALKLCSGEACTDPEVTARVDNSTACVGTSVTFTATGAHASATYQWQKYSGGAWTDIAGAKAATYNIPSVATTDALKYRVIAHHDCDRTSNEVTLNVPSAPVFADFTSTRTVMATQALSITDVEASDATSYAWYKSADATYDAGTDTKVGTAQELLLASGGEAAGATYYLFCVASNACGSTTSSAITVNVTALVEEECATKGNEGVADFEFVNTGCAGETYSETACWKSGGKAKYLTYTAPEGKYFDNAKVTVAVSSGSVAAYGYSTDGSSYTYANLTGLSSALAEKTIDLPANVTHFRIGRNFDPSYGVTTGAFYLSKICFEYSNTCTATTVTPSTSSVDYTMDGVWSNPTFTLGPVAVSGETLTYSSSNEDIASVDESGNVTFNDKAGTVTITASYAGNATYCASEGSYTITVSCSGGAPKIVAADGTNMSGCNSSITLNAKQQDGKTDFTGGSYKWFRNGVEIEGATSKSYTATQTGVYTVEYTSAGECTSPSTNHATVTSDNVEPEVERLVPFQYYHVNKNYSAQMKDRHLFSVKGSAANGSTGRNFKLTMSRNGGEAVDMTTAASIFVTKSGDGQIDTVMIDLNKLSGKYSEGDKLVLTCAAVDCSGNVSAVYKDEITIHVIGAKPTLALICSGTNIAAGTRKTSELTVGGDFLTGYNKADLCQQTDNTTFNANTEWGLYTDLKAKYIVTPVNGYAVFNKLNYEPFDILLLTDYPKASKSDAAATVLDDMADLCDYRPMLSFKTHMVAKSPSKWAAKGFTTSPVVSKTDGCLNLNIVCYAHPMFESLKTGKDVYSDVGNTSAPLVYTMLTDVGYEGSKGMQGFEIAAAENFITIGLTHYDANISKNDQSGEVTWTPDTEDRMLVTVAERQANPEARFILFSLNCGAQSKLTEKGEDVVLACLNYLLGTAEGTIKPADCSFTFDNGEGNKRTDEEQKTNCPSCPTAGDYKWSNPANWGPDYRLLPGEFTSVRIKQPVEVDITNAHVMEARILEDGSITIPAGKALQVKSTIRRMEGSEIYPTEISDIHIGSASTGNGTLIFDNNSGDTKARVDMYSKGFIDGSGVKNYQYIGTPFIEVNALYNYYGSWIYYWGTKKNGNLGWVAVKNGGPMTAWTGYCITQEAPTYHQMSGTLAATGTVDINVPADANMVVGNSWTAPIDINALTTDDLEGLTANIYFFNTGVDKTGTAGAADSRYAGSTYVTIPVEAARYVGEDDHINSLQGFFVKNTNKNSAGTLHLDYERHVRQTTRGSIIGDALHAPARRTALSSDEPTVLKIKVSGENYDDKLLLLEREDFTEGFDNGWDGDKWDGNESALYIYTTDSEGTENSVSAIPELEGTIIGFRAGEDDAYTLNFEYLNSDEPLYLYDVENNTYTPIMTGMTYRFFTTDNEKHARFIITRSNGQEVATGVGEVPSDQVQGTKAKKLLIENKMFIMVNGMLYNATGKVVK